MYIHVLVCLPLCVYCARMCTCGRGQHQIPPQLFLTLLFKTSFLSEAEAPSFSWTGWPASPEGSSWFYHFSAGIACTHHCTCFFFFYTRCEESDIGPCVESTQLNHLFHHLIMLRTSFFKDVTHRSLFLVSPVFPLFRFLPFNPFSPFS